jgi:hypothetical protein
VKPVSAFAISTIVFADTGGVIGGGAGSSSSLLQACNKTIAKVTDIIFVMSFMVRISLVVLIPMSLRQGKFGRSAYWNPKFWK